MTEKPRTWRLTKDALDRYTLKYQHGIQVIELEPVLDLLDTLLDGCTQVSDYFREKYDLAPAVEQAEALISLNTANTAG